MSLYKKIGAIYFSAIILFLCLPLIVIVIVSFGDDQFMRFPPKNFSIRWYEEFFNSSQWINAFLLSLKIAISSTILSTFSGLLISLAFARRKFLGDSLLKALVTAPLVVPSVFLAVGVFILASGFDDLGRTLILICAHTTLSLPFTVLVISGPLSRINIDIERSARVLGAGPIKAFLAASLRQLMPAILASLIFGFFVSFDELIIAEFVMGGKETLPVRIWSNLQLQIDPTISAIATILVALNVVGISIAEIARRSESKNFIGRS